RRVQPDQNHHAVTEQHGHAVVADTERPRRGGQHIAAFEACRVDALRDKEGAGGDPCSAERRFGGLVHAKMRLLTLAEIGLAPQLFGRPRPYHTSAGPFPAPSVDPSGGKNMVAPWMKKPRPRRRLARSSCR